jgi:hypothetical protein
MRILYAAGNDSVQKLNWRQVIFFSGWLVIVFIQLLLDIGVFLPLEEAQSADSVIMHHQ